MTIRVVETRAGRALVAARAFEASAIILVARGVRTRTPTQTSFQLDAETHFDVPAEADDEELVRNHPWRYLNHSCDPNAAWRGTTLVALRAIAPEEEIRFDYESTEEALAVPFACGCGSPRCSGRVIRGFRYLDPQERARRRPARFETDASGGGEWGGVAR